MMLDIKIASYISNKFLSYINIRKQQIKTLEDKKWERKFGANDSFVHKLDENLNINLHKDSLLSRLIYNGFEEAEIIFLKKYLRKGDVFIDIGSNIGLFSLYASKLVGVEGHVYCFEPTPITYKRLLDNITLNSFKNIITNNIGLSDSKGTLEFHVSSNGYDAWNSFASLPEDIYTKTIKVDTITLDEYLYSKEINFNCVTLVKIDVEGWEKFVLKGATDLLNASKPPVFMIEFTEINTFSAGYMCQEIYDIMIDFGFQWYTFNEKDNSLIRQLKQLHYPYNNLFAIKNFDDVIKRLE